MITKGTIAYEIGECCIPVSIPLCHEQAQDKCFRLNTMPSARNMFRIEYRPDLKKKRYMLQYRLKHKNAIMLGQYVVVRKFIASDWDWADKE